MTDGDFKDLSRNKASDNLHHRTIKMERIDIKTSTHIEYGVEHNDKEPKFDFGDHVRISKYKNTTLHPKISQKKFLLLKSLKILCRKHVSLDILTVKNLFRCLMEKNCKRQIK